jgi:hypothetical protein
VSEVNGESLRVGEGREGLGLNGGENELGVFVLIKLS